MTRYCCSFGSSWVGGLAARTMPQPTRIHLRNPQSSRASQPDFKKLMPGVSAGRIFTSSPRICEVATNGLRGESGITEVAPWWANVGAEAGKA